MSRRFILTILAGAVAIASFAAQPARAGNDDLEKLLFGAAALFIIGSAIENHRHELEKQRKKDRKRDVIVKKPKPVRAAVPKYCLRHVETYNGPRRLYGHRCLRKNYAGLRHLPDRCQVTLHGPKGTRHGYRPGCLRKAGFVY